MRTAHLFAGAGGGILADLILGHRPVVAVEWDPYACAVLRRQFPGLRVIEGDVRAVDFTRELADVDAVCAGFPCTDISAANPDGRGIDGERSGLYLEIIRAIDAIRPSWVFLENSPRIRLKGRHVIIGHLVARGYSWRDGILAASDVGAPHQRDRWWLLASNGHRDDRETGRRQHGGRIKQGAPDAASGGADMADPSGLRLEVTQSGTSGDEQPAVAGTGRCPRWWAAEPGMGRMAHGVAHRAHRIRCLGNGQVPLCAAAAWKLLGGPSAY